jgi:hypothetical protein
VAEHEHLWGQWYPKDKRHKYRMCCHPDCKAIEEREVRT